MNKSRWVIAIVVLVILAGAAIRLQKRSAAPSGPAPIATEPAPASAGEVESGQAGLPAEAPALASEEMAVAPAPPPEPLEYTRPIRETKVLQEGTPPKEIVRVKPAQVLASVNGTPVTLKDLVAVPVSQRGAEQTISASLYDMLLERAVVREVAVQAAEAQGIELTPEQRAQLEKNRSEMMSSSPEVIDMTMPPERVAFEQRDTEGRMLLVNLAAAAGAPSAFVTEDQVKAYYEGHKSEFEELPADPQEARWAWQRIDREIRNRLVADTTAAYNQAYDKVVADLKSAATIEITAPVAP